MLVSKTQIDFVSDFPFQTVSIVSGDETNEELSAEEIEKRKDFERRRKEVASAGGLDIKALLGHRISIAPEDEDAEEEEKTGNCEAQVNSEDELEEHPYRSGMDYAEPFRVTGGGPNYSLFALSRTRASPLCSY